MTIEQNARIAQILLRAVARLGVDARADAELLFAHVLQRSRVWLYAHGDAAVTATELALFDQLLARRLAGEPIAQLIGRQGFWTLELNVTNAVLIPRAETELLVERTLAVLPLDQSRRVADLGTGSGAIALAIASERPLAQVVAVDSSNAALAVARSNAESLGLSHRVEFVASDWFERLDGECFDAIASNPPYLAEDDLHLEQGDLRFEPRSALVSGCDGLNAIRKIVVEAPAHLRPQGWLLLEHGWAQAAAVGALLDAAGFVDVATHRDIEDRERVTCGCWCPDQSTLD